jgi:peptidoglycan/LPS O-acetylase OafA/YrhL
MVVSATPVTTPGGPGDATVRDTGSVKAEPRPHLWQVDVMRLLTFAAVISVHSLAFTEQPDNSVAAGAMMLLQFGREVFFALTAFVLTYTLLDRRIGFRAVWRKRLLYVGVPYLAWTVIYYLYSVGTGQVRPSLTTFAIDVVSGGAMYHLYFLLVTLQLYLVFPAILAFVRRTAHVAGRVLIAVSVVNLAWLAVLQYVPSPGGSGRWVWDHAYELLPTYSMYVLAGCYAAAHLPHLQQVLRAHGNRLVALAGLATAGALGVYALQLTSMAPRLADSVLQPAMALSCAAAIIVLYLIGTRWAEGRRRHQRQVEALSDVSFGVYLSHPLILAVLVDFLGFGNTGQKFPPVVATIGAFVISTVGGIAIALLARRTPLSLALAGRPWRAEVQRQPEAAADRHFSIRSNHPAGRVKEVIA